MESVRRRNPCDPCRCPSTKSYFYSEKIPIEDVKQKKAQRPSSASSVKSSTRRKKSNENSSKFTSSDSKIGRRVVTKTKIKTIKNGDERKTRLDSKNVEQLKQDLDTIKEQLFLLAGKKTEALEVTNELEKRFANLKRKCENQEKEIAELKERNENLLQETQESKTIEDIEIKEAIKTKSCLDQYEEKLNYLYTEFLETTKIMEQNKDQICRCIKKKDGEYQDIANSTKELSKVIEDSSVKYAHLLNHYQKSKENERKNSEKNKQLMRSVEELENQLNQMMMELEISREEAFAQSQKHQQEINENCQCFANKLQSKESEIRELSVKVRELERRANCSCKNKSKISESQYEQLLRKYKNMEEALNVYKQNNKKRSEEMEVLKESEKKLVGQLAQLQIFCKKMTTITNEHNSLITRLSNANQDKDEIIKGLKEEITSKIKQIETLSASEDNLKRRISQLQEELVSMRISSYSIQTNNGEETQILCAEECSIHLSEELQDLINALYEEIDKTSEKEEALQKQKKQLQCLQCCLTIKDKELIATRKELKILRDKLNATLIEKQALTGHLKKMDTYYEEYE